MLTILTLEEDDLNGRFANRRPSTHESLAQLPPYLFQEAEQGGKFYLIHGFRHLNTSSRYRTFQCVAYEFDTAEELNQEVTRTVTKVTAMSQMAHISALLAAIPHRTGPSLRERTVRRKRRHRGDDPGREGGGGSQVPAPVRPKPPTRPARDAKQPPQSEA
jgi:hypothetical protein